MWALIALARQYVTLLEFRQGNPAETASSRDRQGESLPPVLTKEAQRQDAWPWNFATFFLVDGPFAPKGPKSMLYT